MVGKLVGLLAMVSAMVGATAVAAPVLATKGAGSCSISPNPDPVGTPYTVTAVSLKPNTYYTAELNEPTHSTEHQKLYLIGFTDAAGTLTVSSDYSGPRGLWTPGTVSVKVFEGEHNATGGTQAQCSFGVV